MGNRGSQEQEDSQGRCCLDYVSLCSHPPPPISHCSLILLYFVSHISSLLFTVSGRCPIRVSFWLSGFKHAPLLPLSVLLSFCLPSLSLLRALFPQSVWVFDYI